MINHEDLEEIDENFNVRLRMNEYEKDMLTQKLKAVMEHKPEIQTNSGLASTSMETTYLQSLLDNIQLQLRQLGADQDQKEIMELTFGRKEHASRNGERLESDVSKFNQNVPSQYQSSMAPNTLNSDLNLNYQS